MALIEKKMRLIGRLGEYEATALFDNGASVSCIRPDIATRFERPILMRVPLRISTADERALMEVSERVSLEFDIDDYRSFTEFFTGSAAHGRGDHWRHNHAAVAVETRLRARTGPHRSARHSDEDLIERREPRI